MNVSLRPICERDTDNIISWRNNPDVLRNFIIQTPLTEEMHRSWLETRVKTGEVAQFIIHANDESMDIGTVFLRDIDLNHKKAEFGIFIGACGKRGKGYGTKAAKLILDYAFYTLKLNRVMLRVFEENAAAIKSYERVGFKKEGIFREDVMIDGKGVNVLYMSILKREWISDHYE